MGANAFTYIVLLVIIVGVVYYVIKNRDKIGKNIENNKKNERKRLLEEAEKKALKKGNVRFVYKIKR